VQASASFAVAALLIVGALIVDEPLAVRLAGAAVAAGALVGFVASRTIGVFGFVEHGLQPWPYALLSLLAEAGVLLLLAVAVPVAQRRHLAVERRSAVDARTLPLANH
jgi:hypothetical protein